MENLQNKVKSYALRLLTRREYSRAELYCKIAAKFPEDLAVSVLDVLQQKGLQSDVRFIENFILTRTNHGYGPMRIQVELHFRGIDDDAIKQNLDFNNPVWRELARKERIKKFGELIPKDWHEKAKQKRFLEYRGFTSDQITAALK